MKHIALVTACMAVALLSGCHVGPDFIAPSTPETTVYIMPDESSGSIQKIELGKQMEADWWTLFASPSLNDIIRQAMAHNNDITAAQHRVRQAQEIVTAENGNRLPQIGLDADTGRQKYGAVLFGPSDFIIPPFGYYEAGLSANWTPDMSGGEQRRIEYRQALADYRLHQLDAAWIALTGNIVTQAMDYATAEAEINATRQIIAIDQDQLTLVKGAVTAGAATKTDILTTQAQLESDKASLPALQQQQSLSRHAIAILIGDAPGDWMPPSLALEQFILPTSLPLRLPSQLAHRRPDILAAEANLHAASAAVGIATSNLYPQINLTATAMQEALMPSGLLDNANKAWSLAAGLTAPLFNGGSLSAEKRAAEQSYQVALAQYRQTVLQAFGQVADALTALAHDADSITTQQESVQTSGMALDLARRRYQAGSAGRLQVLDAERQHAQVRLALVQRQGQQLTDAAHLFVVLGGSPLACVEKQSTADTPCLR